MTFNARERILDSLDGGNNGPPETKPETELTMSAINSKATRAAVESVSRRLARLYFSGRKSERTINLLRFGLYVVPVGDGAQTVEDQTDATGRPCLRITLESVEVMNWKPGAICHNSEGLFPNNYGKSLLARGVLEVREIA